MDWLSGMNQSVNYIEDNLDGDISYSTAAKFVCCSAYEFQRIFSFMTKVTLSEYIRKRRLTLAAHDIQINKEKITDVAIKYGYDSPAAFSRAFKEQHGTTPISARNEGVLLKTYPLISFKFVIQGVDKMEYKIIHKDEVQVIGMSRKMITKNNEHWRDIPKFWDDFKLTGLKDKLNSFALDDVVFAITTYSEEPDCFWYMLAVAYNHVQNTDNYDVMTIPAGTYAVFEVPSENEDNIGNFTMRIFNEWLPSTGYKLTGEAEIECCTKDGTVIWMPIIQ
ncbi:AraC family transcriptional regulator [Clostridium tagluense]|uniref:AraC family transcriptional regulator n=1 Tax=Clostridium tagluense TaxID=360422 RepID=UPI001CF557A7|nr:AraC family transcriptional regulator [Clostridium tagluense]MCB2313669.1 AraC family transcriptional regulator [Clostridium tagluense]MCB2318775.1 AraC family transcriptional regulator [Clostridium tagluense]MCB2323625.1 AraC family transcriptional regulator [Clostridium tagluense]MCB2328524.1 AraC family transcriptional regulator [Clostridium tagluense]MCB2333019.1 AraC family transcriptional regulator [Clostridium tagluense]